MKKTAFALAIALLTAMLFGCAAPPAAPTGGDTVTLSMINIGKADCLLVSAGQSAYLVDTGKAEDYAVIVQALRAKGIARLDGIFLTHGHKDHVGCLAALSGVFAAQKIYYSALDTVTVDKAELSALAHNAGATLQTLKAGDTLTLAQGQPALTLTVLGPAGVDSADENNNSLVLRLDYGDTAFLLMGDALCAVEEQLLSAGAQLSADVLKVGHHGKDDASAQAFLEAVAPRYACITGSRREDEKSVSPAVVARLSALGAKVTASQGDFLTMDYTSDARHVTARSMAAPALPVPASVALRSVDRDAERVVLANEGDQPVDLSGWALWSEKGNQVFLFPAGTKLAAAAQLSVVSGKAPPSGDFVWSYDTIWKKSGDAALLYDANGVLVDSDP
ncbi:MAG: lamin tail domain-containing protein [Eubacteriales bacterium]|nr:lamin tail domain-containing protein [Eubacteriales bacterium]